LQHANSPDVNRVHGLIPALKYQQYNVEGQTYRVSSPSPIPFTTNKYFQITNGLAQIGVNRNDGIVFFNVRVSPKSGATALWDTKVSTDALPALRASSDLAWGLWNRIQGDPSNIKMIMVMNAVNYNTAEVIFPRAMEALGMPGQAIPPWPGVDVVVDEDEEASQAIMGVYNVLGFYCCTTNMSCSPRFAERNRRMLFSLAA
jgi:hypothetical protein